MVIHDCPDLTTPEEHEWWCPFGLNVEIVRVGEGDAVPGVAFGSGFKPLNTGGGGSNPPSRKTSAAVAASTASGSDKGSRKSCEEFESFF